ncbi:hypothetical protein CJD36_009145 [Flavipsychrobacter stenotrophus]|uniref:DUF4397 domain-containing protein n=1 Tax=Flavipsychrobacter stenotrophus TaxID=2077091 RepID=A0A2S7SZA5_9BACT|nr:hypothetical protein [Flavipsychrobacter stenotrophus]PQJ11947.1 hypothetical protein CJD36_009145 [Flavipsychrobacter stenotrophus]
MRHATTLLTAIILAVFVITSNAQSIPAPDFQYKIMGVKEDNTLFSLDKTMMAVKDNAHSLFGSVNTVRALSGKTKVYMTAEGAHAKVVQTGKATDKYIISIPPNEDPEDLIELFAFDEIKKKERIFDYAHITLGVAVNNKKASEDNSIPIVLKKQSDGVYVITTKEPLAEGEYFFKINGAKGTGKMSDAANGNSITAFCFSVGS